MISQLKKFVGIKLNDFEFKTVSTLQVLEESM